MSGKRVLQRDVVLNAVEEIVGADGNTIRYRCRASADEDRPCNYEQTVFIPGNFKRHLLSLHPEVARQLGFASIDEPPIKKPRTSKLIVDTSAKRVLLGTLQMATGNNIPKRFTDWEGTKTLIEPLWNAANFKMSRDKLSELIGNAAALLRKIIAEEVKGKIICLKIDSASRRGRSVFGINLQYIDENGNVCVRHLGKQEFPIK